MAKLKANKIQREKEKVEKKVGVIMNWSIKENLKNLDMAV